MDKKDKRLIVIIACVGAALVILLAVLVSRALSSKTDDALNAGIFKSDAIIAEENQPERETEEERLGEYESREEMPAVAEESFYETISDYLSRGDINGLDTRLRTWQETYKDSTDESESKAAMIAKYRGDIAFYKNIADTETDTTSDWRFKTPDTLAACIAFTPIMKKYEAFIDQETVIFPAVSEGTNIFLREADLTNEELAAIKAEINRTRTAETEFQQIAVYDMRLFEYPCQFIAVIDNDTMSWIPYTLQVTNGMTDLPTVSIGKSIVQSSPNSDLDIIIAVPAAISERPEGMDGNIVPSDGSEDWVLLPAADGEPEEPDAAGADAEADVEIGESETEEASPEAEPVGEGNGF